MFEIHKVVGLDFENIHTGVYEQHKYVWALTFHEKRHKVIFIRLNLWMIIHI